MKNQDKLKTRILHRTGGKSDASSWHERYSIDFLVNGVSLHELLEIAKLDMVGRFSKENPIWNSESVEVFLQKRSPDLENGRVMLFVCPECGDIGCGAITMLISKENEEYIWSLFAYENNYDPGMTDYESYRTVGPFRFSVEQYEQTIRKAGSIEQWRGEK